MATTKKKTEAKSKVQDRVRIRTHRVLLALTDEEYERLGTLAQKEGLQVGTYARVVLFKQLLSPEPLL